MNITLVNLDVEFSPDKNTSFLHQVRIKTKITWVSHQVRIKTKLTKKHECCMKAKIVCTKFVQKINRDHNPLRCRNGTRCCTRLFQLLSYIFCLTLPILLPTKQTRTPGLRILKTKEIIRFRASLLKILFVFFV